MGLELKLWDQESHVVPIEPATFPDEQHFKDGDTEAKKRLSSLPKATQREGSEIKIRTQLWLMLKSSFFFILYYPVRNVKAGTLSYKNPPIHASIHSTICLSTGTSFCLSSDSPLRHPPSLLPSLQPVIQPFIQLVIHPSWLFSSPYSSTVFYLVIHSSMQHLLSSEEVQSISLSNSLKHLWQFFTYSSHLINI